MQDYNINVNYNGVQNQRKTSIADVKLNRAKSQVSKTTIHKEPSSRNNLTLQKATAVVFAGATKINQYIGELTENTVTQRKRQVGLTLAGFGVLAATNPIAAGIGAAMYIGNAAIQYNITAYKENLSADFLKQLSGGVYNTRK